MSEPLGNSAAERAVLGILLTAGTEALTTARRSLRHDELTQPGHTLIYETITSLDDRGVPADPVTVAADLGGGGKLAGIPGGEVYLHELAAAPPAAAALPHFLTQIRDAATRRTISLLAARAQTAATASGNTTPTQIIEDLRTNLDTLTRSHVTEIIPTLTAILADTLTEIDTIQQHGGIIGVPTGYKDLDNHLHGLMPGQMITVAARPGVGKSAFTLDIARNAAIRHGKSVLIFSLEMSAIELGTRALAAEAYVSLTDMRRRGGIDDHQWENIEQACLRMHTAKLGIIDDAAITPEQIRATARAWQTEHGLDLIVIDYLQLMSAPGRQENRQQEVSGYSRFTKLLAKQLSIPVICVSQLNRGPEQRTDRKPLISDLRECLSGDTLITRADTGQSVPIAQLAGHTGIPVWSCDEHLKLTRSVMASVWANGTRPVFRVALASGRTVDATANHPLMSVDGWKPVGQLRAGDSVAVAAAVPTPEHSRATPPSHLVLLAHLIGDGCTSRPPVYYCSTDEANLTVVEQAAATFGVDTTRTRRRSVTYVHFPMRSHPSRRNTNPLYAFIRHHGLEGKVAHTKTLPPVVWSLPDDQVRFFLRHLWATDGSVTTSTAGNVRIYYATTSPVLATQLQTLLLRVGVASRMRATSAPRADTHRQGYVVDVSGGADQRLFLTQIGVHGARSDQCAQALAALRGKAVNPNAGAIPPQVWSHVRRSMKSHGVTTRALARELGMSYCGSSLYRAGISRQRMARVATAVPDEYLHDLASSDITWDRIVNIRAIGERPVFDALVPGTHSFLANDVVSHNSGSIEQDSDVVMLLHREEMYDPDTTRPGEADIFIAKNRSGAPGKIVLAWLAKYSRFADMAR